jgi:hypothetical protein
MYARKIPGFTGEASLYRRRAPYQSIEAQRYGSGEREVMGPACSLEVP